MKWTKTPPTESGWYWVQLETGCGPEIARYYSGRMNDVQVSTPTLSVPGSVFPHCAVSVFAWGDEPISPPMPREPQEKK